MDVQVQLQKRKWIGQICSLTWHLYGAVTVGETWCSELGTPREKDKNLSLHEVDILVGRQRLLP